jgi:hypothetical protein
MSLRERENLIEFGEGSGSSGVHINWAWALSCRILGPTGSWAKYFEKPKRIGFGQLGLSPIQFFYFSSFSSFLPTPIILLLAPKGSLDFSSLPPFSPELYRIISFFLLTRAAPFLSLFFSFLFLLHFCVSSLFFFLSSFFVLLFLISSFLLSLVMLHLF